MTKNRILRNAIEKFEEDCKKRRREYLKSFLDKYEEVNDDDEVVDLRTFQVVDLRTFQVVDKNGKPKKKTNKGFKKKKDAQDKVIKFGELNTYSISFEGKKYVSVIIRNLRKYKGYSTVSEEIEDDSSLLKKYRNRSDILDNFDKSESSQDENPSMCDDSKNETSPLNNAIAPFFRALCPRYIANGKLDCLLCPTVNIDGSLSGDHPVTKMKNRSSYHKDICKFSSNKENDVAENPPIQGISTPQIIKPHPRHRKISASPTCLTPKKSVISTKKGISAFKNVKKHLGGRKVSTTNNCSPCEKGGNSPKTDHLPALMSKRGVNQLFADSTTPASVDMSNKLSVPITYNFKAFFDYTKLWYQRQKQPLENSLHCSYDSHQTDRVLKSKLKDSLYNRKDELINISGIPPEGFISPFTKRLKFAPNIPVDCLTV